ncbi:MAG: alanine racemase [Oscillospiraceae bacterium]|nr:alanine racemase [Oscillospiraceae bacterium]
MDCLHKRTWAEISLENIAHNYRAIRTLIGADCRFMGIVKADGYGHGAVPVARLLEGLGADYLAVACLDEATVLRDAGITIPILILGQTPAEFADTLLQYHVTQSIFELEQAKEFSDAAVARGKRLKVHIKADTGMSRLGFVCTRGRESEAAARIGALKEMPGLEMEGIFTHFANADADETYTMDQFTRFLNLIDCLDKEQNMKFKFRHCAASGAVINYPCTHLDMVRPGLILYGLYPTPEMEGIVDLRPGMSLKSRIVSVKDLEAGTPISYGCTRVLQRDSRVAVLPIGYADGLHRVCSDRLPVLLRGKRTKVLGRICMDMCMIDVTGIPEAKPGDIATLFGVDGEAFLPVEEMAGLAGTVSYEIICSPAVRVPRVYIGSIKGKN